MKPASNAPSGRAEEGDATMRALAATASISAPPPSPGLARTLETLSPVRTRVPWRAAVLIALGGAYGAARGGSPERVAKENRERRKQELLEEAAQLERDLERGDIGPQFRQSRHDAIVRELAVLLHQEQSPRAGDRA